MLTASIADQNLNSETVGHKLRVYVLGRFLIEQGDRLVESEHWRSGKARSLFKILLARRGLQITRQEVAELLWPELDQERAANNLNQAVYSLRRTLEPNLKHASNSIYVKTEGPKIQLNASLIGWVDLEEFKQLYKQAQLTGELELYEQAAVLYGGDYLPEDLYEDWSVGRRETLRQDWSELLMQMALLYQARGMDEKYRQCLRRVLETDFSHEDSVQKLMRALNEAGRREEALTVYRNFAEKLQKRLGIEPLADTRQLYKDISAGKIPSRTGELRLTGENASNKGEAKAMVVVAPTELFRPGIAGPVKNIVASTLATPTEPEILTETELIGRHKEQQIWQQLIRAKAGGMCLVSGTGGVGKSKLIDSFVKQATRMQLEIVYTICYPEFADVAFAPLGYLLEQALEKLNDNEQEEFFRICHPALATILPNVTRLSSLAAGSPELPTQQALFNVLTQTLNWLGKKRRFLFVIENLHFLNTVTLKFLCYLLTQNSLNSLLCASLRPLDSKPELQLLIERVGVTQQTILHLEDLQPAELETLLTAHLQQPIGADLLRHVEAVTKGNPRLALDYTETLRSKARLYLSGGRWEIIQHQQSVELKSAVSIQYMVDYLSPDTLTLLKLGALIGKFFHFETLRQIVSSRQDGAGWWIDLDKTRLGRALTEALASRLLREEKDGYRFTYPLMADGLVQNLPQEQRKCWRQVIESAKG